MRSSVSVTVFQVRKLAPKHRLRFWPLDSIVTAQERRYMLADAAMEIFLKDHTTRLFSFKPGEDAPSARVARAKVKGEQTKASERVSERGRGGE
jgi:hypothetical protein